MIIREVQIKSTIYRIHQRYTHYKNTKTTSAGEDAERKVTESYVHSQQKLGLNNPWVKGYETGLSTSKHLVTGLELEPERATEASHNPGAKEQ